MNELHDDVVVALVTGGVDRVDVELSVSVECAIVLWEHVPGMNMDDFVTIDAVVENAVVVAAVVRDVVKDLEVVAAEALDVKGIGEHLVGRISCCGRWSCRAYRHRAMRRRGCARRKSRHRRRVCRDIFLAERIVAENVV